MKFVKMLFAMMFGRMPSQEPPVHAAGTHLSAAPDSYWDNRFNY